MSMNFYEYERWTARRSPPNVVCLSNVFRVVTTDSGKQAAQSEFLTLNFECAHCTGIVLLEALAASRIQKRTAPFEFQASISRHIRKDKKDYFSKATFLTQCILCDDQLM